MPGTRQQRGPRTPAPHLRGPRSKLHAQPIADAWHSIPWNWISNILHHGVRHVNQSPKPILFMKYVIDLDPTHQVLRVTVTGTVSDPASQEMYASISHFAATGGPYASILDLSGVTGGRVSTQTIRHLAKKPPAVPVGRPRVVVAPRPEDYGLLHMFELLRGKMGGQLHFVLSVDEAYTMLGVSPEDFSQRLFPEQLAA